MIIIFYSPWTFNNTNPKDKPNKVIQKQLSAVVTISGLAYGKIFKRIDIKLKELIF